MKKNKFDKFNKVIGILLIFLGAMLALSINFSSVLSDKVALAIGSVILLSLGTYITILQILSD